MADKDDSNERFSTLILDMKFKNGVHKKLSSISQRTWHDLRSDNLKEAIKCPPNEDVNEWIAANTFDLTNELNILWNILPPAAHKKYSEPGSGFPKGVKYRWDKVNSSLTSEEYVDIALTWIQDQCENPDIFPDVESDRSLKYPEDYIEGYVKKIYVKFFRIFCILYCSYKEDLGQDNMAHLNTCFRHYLFFALEHKLMPADENELIPIRSIVEKLKADYYRKTIVPPGI